MRLMTVQKTSRRPGKFFLARVYPARVASRRCDRVTAPVTSSELSSQRRICEALNRRAKLTQVGGDGYRLGGKVITTDGGWKADTTIQ